MDEITAHAHIIVHAAPRRVFDALVDGEAMSRYWFTRRDAGLRAGSSCTWWIGDADDAPSFEVHVREMVPCELVVIDWDEARTMTWTIEARGGATRLAVEDRGFGGTEAERVTAALDSTGGFNQVVVALKAWVEHGVAIDVVADHA